MADDRDGEATADVQGDTGSDWSSEDESPVSPLEPSVTPEAVEQGWLPLSNGGPEQTEDGPHENGGHHIGIAELRSMTVEELGRRLAAGDTLAVTGEQLLNHQPDEGALGGESQGGGLSLEEEEEEEKNIAQQEAAVAEANAKEEERRRVPLPDSNKEAIVSAMKGFTLNGYKPAWAAGLPDEELVARVKRRSHNGASGT